MGVVQARRLYFRDCQRGGTSLQLHSLKPDPAKTFQPPSLIPPGGASPRKAVLRVPLELSSVISSKAGGKNRSNTSTDALGNAAPSKAAVTTLPRLLTCCACQGNHGSSEPGARVSLNYLKSSKPRSGRRFRKSSGWGEG